MDATFESERNALDLNPDFDLFSESGPGAPSEPHGVQVTGNRALGWFSLALGTAQLVAPGYLGKAIGVGDGPWARWLMRAVGLRELSAGLGLLRGPRSTPWLWSRVAGDVMDLALLGGSYTASRKRDRRRLQGALLAVTGVGAIDLVTARSATLAERQGRVGGATGPVEEVEISASVTVAKPPAEVYAFWRDLGHLSRFMTNVQAVEIIDRARSRWTVKVAGKATTWEARITSDRPNEAIAWETLDESVVAHKGVVTFRPAPGDRGTEVHVKVQVHPPGGIAGRALAKLGKAVPRQQVVNDLRRIKQVLEVGEVMKSDASVHKGAHAARPPKPGAIADDDQQDEYLAISVEEGAR